MLVTIKIDGYSTFELALVHWYDFCYKTMNDVCTNMTVLCYGPQIHITLYLLNQL